MKFIKSINVLGSEFQLIWNKEHSGGSFNYRDRTIEVGILHYKKDVAETFEILAHELSELVHLMLNHRYDDGSVQGNYKFIMDHKEFQNHNRILSSLILKFF